MKEHVKYSNARNQLYGVKVAFRELREKMPRHHRTGELEQVLDILQSVIDQSCDAFEAGNILEVLINVYVPNTLPGFEEFVAKARQAAKAGLPLTDDEIEALEFNMNHFLEHYREPDPFDSAGDFDLGAPFDDKGDLDKDAWEDYNSPPPDLD